MPEEKKKSFTLGSVDDLFSTQEMRDDKKLTKIKDIPIAEIDDFPDHPFKVKDDEDMLNLVDSVKENGILTPAILREKEDGRFEIIAGHRRKRACELAGLKTMRAEVKELSRDDAIIFMVDSNLQRTTILPSEKAFSYKMRLEAMKRKAGRPRKDNAVPVAQDFRGKASRQLLGEQVGESQDNIRRYIRLTELISPILDMVDEGKIALRPAVELSYLSKNLQEELYEIMQIEDCTPSHAQSLKMRKFFAEGNLNPEVICSIMQEEKPNQKEKIVLRDDRIRRLIPKTIPIEKTEEYVIKALEHYGKFRQKQKQQER